MKTKQPLAGSEEISQRFRRYLYFSAAVTGGVIMIVEILGAKMLAPYIGTSHFVWTAQIAVTLVALSAGYYVGGRLVDRSPNLGRLYGSILAAAVYLSLTVSVAEPVAYWCLQFNLALGSLLASTFLFFVPLALLAMVGPYLVRVLTESVSDVGGNVGRLTAISTLGSFIGTVLIGYVLIPFLPNPVSMYLAAALLTGLVVGYFVVRERKAVPLVLLLSAAGLAIGYGGIQRSPQFGHSVEIYRGNSNFGLLQVLDDKRAHRRYFMNDYLMQNSYDPVAKKSLSTFTYMLHGLARAYTPEIQSVLCIGLGIGIIPMEFAREGARVDVVEINPSVVPLAKEYFDLETDHLNVILGDGRYFINRCTNRYDTVILDAFLGDSSPSHLMTREAFEGIHQLLKPGGTLVINSIGNMGRGKDFLSSSLERTLNSVFKSVRVHSNRGQIGVLNVFFVASDQAELVMKQSLELDSVHPTLRQDVRATFAGVLRTDPNHGLVLKDRYNPSEFYDASIREEFRRRMAHLIKTL